MFYAYLTLLMLICACAAPVTRRDDRRVPRGWTLDTSKQDLSAISIREQKAFGEGKVVLTDNFSADNLTTEAVLGSTDGKKQIRHLIEEHNKLLCINQALEDAKEELEDKRCFATLRAVERLEVHVSTSIGALRRESKWPEFKVVLGGDDGADFDFASALDGGTVIFRKKFKLEKKDGKIQNDYNMKDLLQDGINIELNGSTNKYDYINDYVKFTESFGGEFCTERRFWGGLGGCRKKATLKTSVSIETNRLHIDRVKIYLYFADDDRPYKIFASRSSTQSPLTILDNVVRSYSIAGIKNNPHWLLHYHSAKCDAWQGDHDGSAFGKYIWNNYIKQNNHGSIDIYASPLHCAGTSTVPAYVEPAIPKIDTAADIDKWISDNEDKFKPHVNNSKAECQPRTAAVIREEAITQEKCGKKPEDPLEVPADLDTWKPSRLSDRGSYLEKRNKNFKISNEGLSDNIDTETGSSCFYKKPLLGGIRVKITGQILLNVGGKLMTRRKANDCIFNNASPSSVKDSNQVYINLGLNAESYQIMTHNSGNQQSGRFDIDGVIRDTYTKNFAMRDISFVHLEKTASEEFFTYEETATTTYDKFWGEDLTVSAVSVAVEQGIVAISSIELNFNDDVIYSLGSPPKPLEEGETDIDYCVKNDSDDALFVLTNSNNVWVDYNVQGNEKWIDYRDEKDLNCEEEE